MTMTNKEFKEYMQKNGTNEALLKAVQVANIEQVEMALDAGADINATDSEGRNALMLLQPSDSTLDPTLQYSIAKKLIEAGINLNAMDKDGCTALYFALGFTDLGKDCKMRFNRVYMGSPVYIKMLIEAGADINFCAQSLGMLFLGPEISLVHQNRPALFDDIPVHTEPTEFISKTLEAMKKGDEIALDTMLEQDPIVGRRFYEALKILCDAGIAIDDVAADFINEHGNHNIQSPKYLNSCPRCNSKSYTPLKDWLYKPQETKKRLMEKRSKKTIKGVSGVVVADKIAEMIRSGKITGDVTPEMGKKLRGKITHEMMMAKAMKAAQR